ncbi:MAG TPA: TOBE domain-containing protein [Rubrivivax sp.]|nr:TOBE domain-containing protein [Rubrivivax sp.]
MGSAATLCLRPEFLQLHAAEAVIEGNRVRGHIESLAFVGDACEAEVRVGEALLLARTDPDTPLREGDAVSLSIAPAHCLLLAA